MGFQLGGGGVNTPLWLDPPPPGGILARCAHCALLLDYVPPEEPHPLETPLELGDPNSPIQQSNTSDITPVISKIHLAGIINLDVKEQTSTQACCGKAMKSALIATLNNTQMSFCSIVN